MPLAFRTSTSPVIGPNGETLAIGTLLLGKYVVERVLGEGGMGVVVLANHVQLGQRVAIKFLRPAATAAADNVMRFSREARAAAQIDNEHVTRVYDVGTLDAGTPYIVMEYLQGRDLDALLEERGGALRVEEALDYLLQTCEALAAAHAAGIVHRDLKPANLFLAERRDGSTTIKVLDFGISKMANDMGSSRATSTQSIMGSPAFMAPEQMRSSTRVDARADIWSLGVILHTMLCGRLPWDSPSIPELFSMILTEPPPHLAMVDPRLAAVVRTCLEKDVTKRFASVDELVTALAPFAPDRLRLSIESVRRITLISSSALPRPSAAQLSAQSRRGAESRSHVPANALMTLAADEAPFAAAALGAPVSSFGVFSPATQTAEGLSSALSGVAPVTGNGNTRASTTKRWLIVGGVGALAALGAFAFATVGRSSHEANASSASSPAPADRAAGPATPSAPTEEASPIPPVPAPFDRATNGTRAPSPSAPPRAIAPAGTAATTSAQRRRPVPTTAASARRENGPPVDDFGTRQ